MMGFQCFVAGAVIDLGRLVCLDCGRRTPLRYSASPLNLGPIPTNWNRVREEKCSFVTLFNWGLAYYSLTPTGPFKHFFRKKREGCRCCWLGLLAVHSYVTLVPPICIGGSHLQKQDTTDISVALHERSKEARDGGTSFGRVYKALQSEGVQFTPGEASPTPQSPNNHHLAEI